MMTTSTIGIIVILAALILGGVIAALGDRVAKWAAKHKILIPGFKKLRPRDRATAVAVLTGTLIAASTWAILLASSEPLRKGLFELDQILKELRIAQDRLKDTRREKQQIEGELEAAKTEQTTVQQRLKTINSNFAKAQAQLKAVSGQSQQLRSDIQTLLQEREQLQQQRKNLDSQIKNLKSEIRARDQELNQKEEKINTQDQALRERQAKLQTLEKQLTTLQQQQQTLQTEINQRDERIATLDEAIAQKDDNLQQRETQLKELETQLAFLQRQVEVLEEYYQTYQDLRERQIAIVRGQVLAFGAVRIINPDAVVSVVDELLRQANRTAIQAVNPENPEATSQERVVKITKAQVEQLMEQLQDGQDYVIRILSAGNYVQGEKDVRVFADVVPNQKIFDEEVAIAAVSLDPENRTEAEVQQRLDLLLSATQFRARRAGILGQIQVEDGKIKTLIDFVEQLSNEEKPIDEVRAIASGDTYTVGPLKLHLVALRNGKVIFSTYT